MPWIKALHIVFVIAWFAGLFYLPRLFVYHAQSEDAPSRERFKVMERKLYRGIMMPAMLLTLASGLWLWLGYGFAGGWLHPEPAEAGVAFAGPFDLVYEANLHSRIASRILWRVARFAYRNEDDIYAQAKEVRWRDHFSAERTFKIETNAHRSPVKSLDFV